MKIEFIKKLIELIEERNIDEIEIRGFIKGVRIKKSSDGARAITHVSRNPLLEIREEKEEKEKEKGEIGDEEIENGFVIKAPMVGTFYRAPAPDASPYVEIGDRIIIGQVVCIIEAMKIMNEIESEVRGTVIDIFVKNEDPVEFNQKLFLIKQG